MAQAIVIACLVGTEKYPGGRIQCKAAAGTRYFDKDDSLDLLENVGNALRKYLDKIGWGGEWHLGCLPSGDWVAVCEDHDCATRNKYRVMVG